MRTYINLILMLIYKRNLPECSLSLEFTVVSRIIYLKSITLVTYLFITTTAYLHCYNHQFVIIH